jgi:L-2-hydroxyglutarate oxidase
MIYDFAIIGGGIIGLSTAFSIKKLKPSASILLVEKESALGSHQTSHNSGVVHAGIYYEPGSLKAQFCKQGLRSTIDFCQKNDIKYEQCGKLIVATNNIEIQRLNVLYERARLNGLKTTLIDATELKIMEPNISGLKAIYSPETAIVDYHHIALKLADLIKKQGVEIILENSIERITEKYNEVTFSSNKNSWRAKKLIVSGGLQADRLARMAGLPINFKIIPFRGEYFQLPKSKNKIINHLIYPVPNPKLPFLGIHLTRMIDGTITVGPNAVLGFSREHYKKYSFNFSDISSYLSYPGFWKLLWLNKENVYKEFKSSISMETYLIECKKYYSNIELNDLLPYPAGIRAQVVNEKGLLVHDFLFAKTERMFHVYNAPSPAATSALPIGNMIAEKFCK